MGTPGEPSRQVVVQVAPGVYSKLPQVQILVPELGKVTLPPLVKLTTFPLMLKSSGVIFKNEDLSSFGSIIARDFEKPCIVKAKVQINSDINQAELNASTGKLYGPEQATETQLESEAPTETINLDGIYKSLEGVEHELTTLNAQLTEARSQNLLSDSDREKSKLISDLEWEVRELKEKLSRHLQ